MITSWENPKTDYSHPDSAIRLASCAHRFRVPRMNPNRSVAFARSFKTTGKHSKTRKTMLQADEFRTKLHAATAADKVSHELVVVDSRRYQPLIQQIWLSCKVQPEVARLDERLIFEWNSGVEENAKKFFKSEAIMYDWVMAIVAEGLGKAGAATDASIAGEFAAASRDFAAAVGIFAFLADDQLPKWIARGTNVDGDELPVECSVGVAKALSTLFMANGQQMAVATLLIKAGTPNYSLVAKLCLGIVELLEDFISQMRNDCFKQMSRIDKEFFTLVTFQTQIHKALSMYFQARALWEQQSDYGNAIGLLSDATLALETRATAASEGLPDVVATRNLSPLNKDVKDLREHMKKLLRHWEKDNSAIYFEKVPHRVPEDKKLAAGIQMKKSEKFTVPDVAPVLLALPRDVLERSDSDIARELDRKLNMNG
eukprot:CAMPEP_0119545580 /NCGR_PEP_ID=MMETSP1352-20130426/286_1 /TAXON_ID=265584 /ORGANISM="Stauroneis constricta, Strain CCMP1120" /LENGTH=427 /DNA_ID=CAMNT_0007590143 /DNA_START=162 /DNA_END=1445 /DNA_ORIENTATION=+